ncbi:MAG: hypothetical protein J6Q02_03650, partial [Lachnospiraceae bacterium]|nr:hypothetical protein [Lachnospiraceae bacterium]
MAGPKAPKDPTAKGSNFYICRQKEVAGNPTPDGRGVQFIYLDGERRTTFAKMVGSVTDETMINNLRSAEGFLSMVAGIGVTVEAQDADNAIDFVFQMYGKRDTYGSGDQLRVRCRPDGMEQIIWLDDHEWGDDNAVVGQMRFEFEKPGTLATIDVKLYLREGFEAPEQEERTEIRVESEAYQAILGRSLMNLGNYARVKRVLDRAKRGEEVTIAFIGGSITQGAGATPIDKKAYAYQTWERFKGNFGENVKLIKAGVGGTFVASAALDGFDAEIDAKTGVVITDGYQESGNVYKVHPDSGITIKGFQIPQWDELVEFVDEIMAALPGYNYV